MQPKIIAITATVAACLCWLCACSPLAGQWQFKEISRTRSPDGEVEAILLTGDAGATTARSTLVLLVPSGGRVDTEKPRQFDIVFQADHLKGLNLVWKKAQLLEIKYEEARISQFKNLWEIWDKRPTSYAVEVRLGPMKPDFSVPLEDRMPYPTRAK